MSNILIDILGLLKRKKIVRTPNNKDYIPLSTLSDFKRNGVKPNPQYQAGVISITDLKSFITSGIGGGSVILGRTLVVSEDGDDTAALAAGGYDLSKQWANPTVAMANAVIGDTVLVLTGRYRIGAGEAVVDDGNQQMVKDGVTLYMMPGAIIQYTNQTGTASLPFTDASGAGQFKIRGNGTFIFNRNVSGGDSFLVTTNVNSVVDWEFDEIDIRRRWGGSGYNAKLWRMVGRKYLNRESMIFALRNTGTTVDRFVEIDIEELEIGTENPNNTWTRQELRSFGNGSIVNIHYGRVTYPSAFPNGAFHQNTSCTAGATINIQIDNIYREGFINTFFEDIIRNESSFHGGTLRLTNVNTQGAILLTIGSGGNDNTKRYNYIEGKIRSGWPNTSSLISPVVIIDTNDTVTTEIDIVSDSGSTQCVGLLIRNSPNHVLTGRMIWNEPNESVRLLANGTNNHGLYKDLVISILTSADSVINLSPGAQNMRILSMYVTNPVSTANGGVVQQIGTIVVDSNV